MTNTEQLLLDPDGLPILTDIVNEGIRQAPAGRQHARRPADEIASELLGNEAFRIHLDEVVTTLTRNVCQQMEQALKPVLEQAIIMALKDNDTLPFEAVRQQLETSLPELVASALQVSEDTPE